MTCYKHILLNTVVPGTEADEDKRKRYEDIKCYVNSRIPDKLYRFRSISERSLSALYNDELWFANGTQMNDDFDARLYYDKKKIVDWLKLSMLEDGRLMPVVTAMTLGKVPSEINDLVPTSFIPMLRSLSEEQVKNLSLETFQYVLNHLDTELKKITYQVQSGTKFACFTSKIDSDMMWGQYADNATGFAVEYEFGSNNIVSYYDERDKNALAFGQLFPVLYDNERIDTTDYAKYLFQIQILLRLANDKGVPIPTDLIGKIVQCPDEFMATKLALCKSLEWKQEDEWRMFYVTNHPMWTMEQNSFVHQKISAIYLGRKIGNIYQKIITEMAIEKKIPVYKMEFRAADRTYKLGHQKILFS